MKIMTWKIVSLQFFFLDVEEGSASISGFINNLQTIAVLRKLP